MMHFPDSPATVHTLKNGLTVIIDSTVEAAVVSCQFWVQTGSMHEHPFLGSGISHLLEHMVFKGTDKYSSETLGKTVQAAGGQWNAYTTFDRTVYYIDGPADSTGTFLDVLSEMMFRPTFDEDEFTSERDVIRREIDMGLDSAESQNTQLLFETIYQRDARRHPVIGHLDLFNALTHQDMVDYHARRYTPRNMFVVVAGKVDEDDVLSQLDTLTPAGATRFDDQSFYPQEPLQLGRRVRRKDFAVHASHLTLTWQAPDLSHPDAPALDLLATILGSGRSSILYRQLREEQELCLHIGASTWLPADGPGLFAVSAEVSPDGRDSLEDTILRTIEAALHSELGSLLPKARRMILTSQFRTLTTASGRASDLASNWHEARNVDFTRDYLVSLEKVTAEDLIAAARRWLTQEKLSVISLDPTVERKIEAPHVSTSSKPEAALSMHQLSNGLQVVLGRDDRLPLLNLCTASLAGTVSETADTHGANTLLATLLDKGTPSVSAESLALQLDEKGARFSANSGNNSFLTMAECLTDDSSTITQLMGDLLVNATLPAAAIDRERAALIAGIEDSREKPLPEAIRHARSLLFGDSGYGLNRSGSPESLNQLTHGTLAQHRDEHLCSANTVLTAFGSFKETELQEQLETAFSSVPTGQRVEPSASGITTGQNKRVTLDKEQAALAIAFPTEGLKNTQDAVALELIDAYTSDMSGPLFVKIREELGLAYTVGSTLWHGIDTGMLTFYLATAPEHLDKAMTELLAELQELGQKGIPESVFQATQTSLIARTELGNQANASRAQQCAIDSLMGFAPDYHRHQAPRISAQTQKAVRAVAADILSQAATIVEVTP